MKSVAKWPFVDEPIVQYYRVATLVIGALCVLFLVVGIVLQ